MKLTKKKAKEILESIVWSFPGLADGETPVHGQTLIAALAYRLHGFRLKVPNPGGELPPKIIEKGKNDVSRSRQ
jgi:hypothetical protein